MKSSLNILFLFLLILFINSCSSMKVDLGEKYQPLGTAVLAADSLLLAKYPHKLECIQENEYKELLREDYTPMYDRLFSYSVKTKPADNSCVVSVFDGEVLILTDWLCTEGRIDCWSYNGECNPEELKVECDR